MRWLLLIGTLLTLALSFTRHSGGAMGLWLLLGIVGAVATALAFAQARIDAHSRADSLSDYELQRLREGKPPLNR
ncbi:hypothetical protein [Dyella sp. 2RAB6]|uniref:hypothetical protein n=1 Tax=Dyella sp. 2RAB6 TaxID=3232992 RepID=UPI003F92BF87